MDISRYFSENICEEEKHLMQEMDNVCRDLMDLQSWFELLKANYKYKNIPKRVYLRATTLLSGYVWFNEDEYQQRLIQGKPVRRVTPREYTLEKQLEVLKSA